MFRCGEVRHSGHVRDTETCQRNKIISTVTRQGTRLTYRCHCAVCVLCITQCECSGCPRIKWGRGRCQCWASLAVWPRTQVGVTQCPRTALLSTTAGNYTCALPGSELSATLEISIHQARGEAAHCTPTLVTPCLARNNNTIHEYFIRNCLQNYINWLTGTVGQLALPSTNQIITEI